MPRGRPTDEKKEKMVRVRISEATYERILMVSDGNISKYIRDKLESNSSDNHPELTKMVNISGGDIDVFMDELCGLVESGEIRLMNGHIAEAYIGLDMEKFFEACDASGKDPQGVLDAVTANIWRM